MIYDHLIINHAVPREKLGESSLQIYQELLARCCDSNERVQEKAEDTLEAMITNEKIRNAGDMHEALLQPFQVTKEISDYVCFGYCLLNLWCSLFSCDSFFMWHLLLDK